MKTKKKDSTPSIEKEIPNKETIEALKESEEMRKNPEKYKKYNSLEEVLEELNSEDDVE